MAGKHIVLLGDSIFDNKVYVPEGNSVQEHLLNALSTPDTASLLAVDGAVIESVFHQVEKIPDSATHLVLSVGGNDALYLESSIMSESSENVHSSLSQMKAAVQTFEHEYEQIIAKLRRFDLPLTVCTIYDCVPGLDDADLAGLAIINDIITRTAFKNGLGLIDLRLLCNESEDYSEISPIEPSHAGGAKISAAILQVVSGDAASSQVFC